MPELPDITVYLEALQRRIQDQTLESLKLRSPFLLRTALPPISSVIGHRVRAVRRIGKRLAIGLDDELWMVLHLMIAGRLHWQERGAKLPGKQAQAVWDFSTGTLTLTEAGTKRRASLHLVHGEADLIALDSGGIDVLKCSACEFAEALTRENHTLKRALTDPHLFSGIGNAYSDEILHRARLSPVALTRNVKRDETERLLSAVRETLQEWIVRLRQEAGETFPEGVTAFRPEMAVHGKYGQACPVCGAKVQRIRYAENETNYCPTCQTKGRLLADRALSRLLKEDWPRTPEELEERRTAGRPQVSSSDSCLR